MNKLLWTRRSLKDLESIYYYIAQDSQSVAKDVITGIKKLTENLSYQPFMGRQERKEGTRELVLVKTPFIVVYRIRDDTVEVLRILHSSQKYS
jgi:toxin ParE1/3/4